MPFTLAHPAAALPLRGSLGRLGSASALVIGSMTPDLAYFIPMGVSGRQSHSPAGVLWFCVPVGIVVWLAYLALFRAFGIAILPEAISLRLRASVAERVSWPAVVAAAVSVAVGACTHLAWDSFTHESGVAVRAFPVLRTRVPLAGFYEPRLFTLLQHASGAAGLGILAVLGIRWYRRTAPGPRGRSRPLPAWAKAAFWLVVVLPSAAVGMTLLGLRLGSEDSLHVLRTSVRRAVFPAGTVLLMSVTTAALAWRVGGAGRFGRSRVKAKRARDEPGG
jgi:hypothetical protein